MRSATRARSTLLLLAASVLGGVPARASEPGSRCIACHAKQVEGYRAGGMARALGPFVPGELDGVRPPPDVADPHTYRFETSGGAARVVESARSADGARRDVASAEILFAIGAGIVDRSYAVRRGDVMAFAPLEVVREHGGTRRAHPSPGQTIDPRARFGVAVTEECLRCHTSSLPPRDHPYDLVPPPDWVPSGIDCVACHARGDAHARWHEQASTGATPAGADPIAGDASARRAGFDSCARCHLQGDALVSIAEPRRGIPPPDADPFAARAVFVAADPGSDVGFVSHVERLTLSACFLATRDRETGALLCTTCHDPHRSLTDPVERDRVRAACTKCHAESVERSECSLPRDRRGEAGCVDCHMRRTGVYDVAHVEIHDHKIERRPPPPSKHARLRLDAAPDGRIARFLANGDRSTDRARDPGLWLMAFLDIGRRDLASALLSVEPGAAAAAHPGFHHLRAGLRESTGDLAGAEADLRRALALDSDQAESAVNLGALLVAKQRQREAVDLLTRVVERHPRSEGALRNRGAARLGLGDLDGAAQDLEASFAVRPTPAVARLLGQVHRARGCEDLARRWLDVHAAAQ